MSTGDNVVSRMSDVLFALCEAEKAKVRPTKIQLQKFIYLTDVLGQVVGLMKLREGHKTYRNGPYDPSIQNAVDALAFRGLVQVAGLWRTPSGHLAASYVLAAPGRILLDRLRGAKELARKVHVAGLVGAELSELGWDRIVDLVYAEPTFVATRSYGWGADLVVEDGLSVSAAFVLAVMRRVATMLQSERAASPEWVGERFFAYLNDYDHHYRTSVS